MTPPAESTADFEAALAAGIAGSHGLFDRAVVLPEAASTQDEARGLSGRPGLIVTTLHQTAGRGTRGRAWSSASGHGLAITFTCQGPPAAQGRASLAAGVAAARACRACLAPVLAPSVGIKWPNDVVATSEAGLLKLGGILIEVQGDCLFIGIGINVSQQPSDFPADIAPLATSLHQLGSNVRRCDLAASLTRELADLWSREDDEITSLWKSLDKLSGRSAVLLHDAQRFSGRIESINPLECLVLLAPDGTTQVFPARSTTLARNDSSSSRTVE